MATLSPTSAPPPASPPPIITPSVPSPPNSTDIPPATPSAPSPPNSTDIPPATPSAPSPPNSTDIPPASPSATPPTTPSAPPPATPSAPPPATPSAPPPATPSTPSTPSTPLTPSPPATSTPATPSASSPPTTVLTPPPVTPSSPPPPATVLTPPSLSTPPPPAEVSTPPAIPSPPTSTAPPPSESPPVPASPTPSISPSQPTNSSEPSTPSLPVPVSPSPPDSTISPPPPPPPPNPNSDSDSNSSASGISTAAVAGIAVGGGLFLLLLLAIFFIFRKRKSRANVAQAHHHDGDGNGHPTSVQSKWQEQNHVMVLKPANLSSSGASGSTYSIPATPYQGHAASGLGFSQNLFTYDEIVKATDGFSDANLLGQGGFGYVHRGVLSNGKQVAVKQLKAGSGQGEREFQAEVEIISRVHHRHLVSLVGYCTTGDKRILIYEFVPNYTMEFHLHGKGRPTMEWSTRMKIALGSAKGLAYLHEDCHPKIIHRDIKSANILIDYQFEAKVADFGLAKFTTDNNTHVSTRVMGTFGYLAPEYASSGKLSEKSDVFSFGVMLLELITGRRPIDTTNTFNDDSLVDWARPLLTRAIEENKYDGLIDPRLQNNYDVNEMAQMVASAAACIRHSARRRPRMSSIVRTLEGDVNLDDMHQGIKPGHSTMYNSSVESSDYDSAMYREDMNKFRKLALTSQEYGSSEYSHGTSDYGLNPSGSSSDIQPQ